MPPSRVHTQYQVLKRLRFVDSGNSISIAHVDVGEYEDVLNGTIIVFGVSISNYLRSSCDLNYC